MTRMQQPASHAAHLHDLRAHAAQTFAQALELNVPERWHEATAAYQQLVTHNPTQGEYWWRLAISHDHLEAFSPAQEAYRQALALGIYRPWVLFALGRLSARFGDSEAAIAWLTQAMQARLGFLTDLQTDSAFDSLRADPRFLDLLPPVVSADTPRDAGWRIDLAYLARRLEQAHFDLFRQVSRDAWHTAMSDLGGRLPALSDQAIVAGLMRLIVTSCATGRNPTPAPGGAHGILGGMQHHSPHTNLLHRVFALGVWVKGIDGVLEIVGGAILLLIRNTTLNQLVIALTQHELVEDPHDLLANAARQAVAQLSVSTKVFGGVYLIAHGLAKVVLVVGLLRGYRWAYPVALVFLGLFIAYQVYRLSYQFSPGLLLLTLFDIAIVALLWREYRLLEATPRLEKE